MGLDKRKKILVVDDFNINPFDIQNKKLKSISKSEIPFHQPDILLDKNDIDDINLISLGMDSLDVAELILAFEEKYNIDLEDQQLYRFKSIRNFINCVFEKITE
jgi:acyl carrier protein